MDDLFIDVSEVLGLKEEEQHISKIIFSKLSKIADEWIDDKGDGILIVVGNFYSGIIHNVDFISGTNLITEDDKIWIHNEDSGVKIKSFSTEPNDGAILVHLNGKVIAAGINLILDDRQKLKAARGANPTNGGMRHIAGIYTSMREDVLSVIIMSGETGKVTLWKNGERIKIYDPIKEKNVNGEKK